MAEIVLGIDLGGTNIKFGLVEDGRVREKGTIPTEANLGKDAVISKVVGIVRIFEKQVSKVGLAVAGLVEHHEGIVFSPPNLPGWDVVKLKEIVTNETGKEIYVLNDANAYAIGEWRYGAGRGKNDIVAVTLGTGVGGGIVSGGKLVLGATHFGGEIGHMVIDPTGPQCNCGQRGCWEAYLGNGYFSQRIKAYYTRDGLYLEEYSPEKLSELAKGGDYKAQKLWEEYGEYLGLGLVNLIHIFDPELVVIGGGISNAFEFFISSCLDVLSERVMSFSHRKVSVVKALLGEEASILGASYFAIQEGNV